MRKDNYGQNRIKRRAIFRSLQDVAEMYSLNLGKLQADLETVAGK
jgi:hypothetical protein